MPNDPVPIPPEHHAEILRIDDEPVVNVKFQKRDLPMVTLSHSELDSLTSMSGTLDASFLGASVGALISFGSTLATVTNLSDRTFAVYVALSVVASFFTVFFGIRCVTGLLNRASHLKRLKGT